MRFEFSLMYGIGLPARPAVAMQPRLAGKPVRYKRETL